ncbi:acetate kinase [Persicobacter psychrovividus]|uniref:Acetate kinase n=1 Tax=Persicobacter psychrovividus TaxID=387638 RepID=A0ABN6L741_9BACT|nr:acetate kinase [Persicobacter psychrovividus]
MNILVLNCGSSSIKFQLFNTETREVKITGLVEKVGLAGAFLTIKDNNGKKVVFDGEINDHTQGIEYVLGIITSKKHGVIADMNEIDAVGHRVTHGGEHFKKSTLITDSVREDIKKLFDLAPLHNPANMMGISAIDTLLPEVPQVAVFDTAFHQTMPAKAYMYAIPYQLYKKYGIRRYGFHGTSHQYVAERACEVLGWDITTKKIITCHLGGGASVTAIENGKSVDTSMGMTPTEGMIMGTRAGDVDLGVLTYIMIQEGIDANAANSLINKRSGMLGVSGISSDMRDILEGMKNGNERAQLAYDMYCQRIAKYVGSYTAVMKGVDLILFTGGIGENAFYVRKDVSDHFPYLGVELNDELNATTFGTETEISTPDSKVKVMVLPTNEEFMIARDTEEIVNAL